MGRNEEIPVINGESCPNHLRRYVQRGEFFAGMLNGKIVVHHGSPHGYPLGDSVMLGITPDQIPLMIAVLRAAQENCL